MTQKKAAGEPSSKIGVGLALGIGIALGAAFDSVGIGIAMGTGSASRMASRDQYGRKK